MSLAAGTRLGPYEIISPLGRGGMGDVYRAQDTRLNRTVALKTLSQDHTSEPDSRRRFEREARLISGLSHPNICALFDVGHEGEIDYLVMEYLEGETLEDHLIRGALPPEQTLQYGIQIADALEHAHRQGVIHRDLKPGNIMLTKSGAKLLDFGLAKLRSQSVEQSVAVATVTDLTREQNLTNKGVILGTFRYMAPEQLEGKDADIRSDIFALGTVLYEMATSKPAFDGKSRASLIASILSSEPTSIATLQPMTPPALERAVKICLAKDPDERWQRAHDVKLELKWIAEGGSQACVPLPIALRRRTRERWAWIGMVLAFMVALPLAIGYLRRSPAPAAVTRFAILTPEAHALEWFTISPDGRKLVLLTRNQENKTSLWIRPLDSISAHELPGTEGSDAPVWSPDSRFLMFIAEGKLKRIDTSGGIPENLCELKDMAVGSWNSSDTVLLTFSLTGSAAPTAIQQLRPDDCALKPATVLDRSRYDFGHQWPSFLPDGKHFLYAGLRTNKKHDVMLDMLGSDVSQVLIHNASDAKYAPPGYLLFERNGFLFAQHFSLSKLRLLGKPVQVVPQQLEYAALGGMAAYDVSTNGLLVYKETPENSNAVVIRDAAGKELQRLTQEPFLTDIRISPDGRKVLIDKVSVQTHTGDLWTIDLQRKNWERLSFEASTGSHIGVWSPDAQVVVYAAAEKGVFQLHRRLLNQSGSAEILAKSALDQVPTDWSPDGQYLVYTQTNTSGAGDLWVMPMQEKQQPYPLAETRFDEQGARFSPDGRWLVYSSDESGKREVYIASLCWTAHEEAALVWRWTKSEMEP
jgi:eukaryotic-like serine/threonine-protein kinase